MIFIFLKIPDKVNFLNFLIFLNEYFDLENGNRLILIQEGYCLSLFHIKKFSYSFLKDLTNKKNHYQIYKINIAYYE